jgi:hypothetical protein
MHPDAVKTRDIWKNLSIDFRMFLSDNFFFFLMFLNNLQDAEYKKEIEQVLVYMKFLFNLYRYEVV